MSVEPRSDREERIDEVAQAAGNVAWWQTRAILRALILILLVAGLIWTLYALESVLLLLVLSIFFAYLIAPLVEILRTRIKIGQAQTLPRGPVIGLVYLIIFGSFGGSIYLLFPYVGTQINQLIQQLPDYLLTARGRTQNLDNLYQYYQIPVAVRAVVNTALNDILNAANEYARWLLMESISSLKYLPWLILVPVISFFLLRDAEVFRRSALQILPRGHLRGRGAEIFQEINSALAAYIRAQLTACAIIGVICTIGFALIGVPYALVLGIFAGMMEFIPLAGPLFVAGVVTLIASFHSVTEAVMVFIFLLVLRIVQDYLIYPRIIGQGIHLHPLAVILAILCGAELAGVAGVFLAIPVIAIISIGYRHWLEYRGSSGLVAELLKPSTPELITTEQPSMTDTTLDTAPDTHNATHTTTHTDGTAIKILLTDHK